jgi:ribose/xylose/arabinose/galactoside ABC-type transport system permease subunit
MPVLIFAASCGASRHPAGQDAVRAQGLCGGRQRHGGHLLGHPRARVVFTTYMISAFCVATAGLIQASRTLGAQNTVGQGMELEVLAAVILGGASLLGGSGTIFKTVIGVLILGFIQNGLLLAGLEFYVQFVVTWIIIILAVWLDIATKRGKLWSPIA